MVDATYIDNGRIQVVAADDVAFDTARPSVTLYPDASRVVHNGYGIEFPSLIQARAYYRNAYGNGSYCELWSTLFWQEWGPSEPYYNENYFSQNPGNSRPGPTTRNLPQQHLGSVPASSNYLDIRVRLTRTITPPPFGGIQPPIPLFPEGEWITLPGGSCTVEYFPPMIRHFDIVREGNDLWLRRYQSVRNTNSLAAPGGNPQAAISSNQSGWNSLNQKLVGVSTYSDGTDGAQLNPYSNTELAVLINARGPANDGRSRRPNSGSDECAGGWPDLRSFYTADIIITPGRYRPG